MLGIGYTKKVVSVKLNRARRVIPLAFEVAVGDEDDVFCLGDEVVFIEAVDNRRVRMYRGVYVAKVSETWAMVEYSYTYAGNLFTDRTMVKVDYMREYNEWLADGSAYPHRLDGWM